MYLIISLFDSELQSSIMQNKQKADEVLLSFINKQMEESCQV